VKRSTRKKSISDEADARRFDETRSEDNDAATDLKRKRRTNEVRAP
jgi:hypothetical protein